MDKIISVNYGIGSAYHDKDGMAMEINHKLNEKLRISVINHEKRHRTGSYGKEDFLNDFQSKKSYFLESLWFAVKNPEMLIGFMPFMYSYYYKIMTFNSSSLIPFVWFGLIFSAFFGVIFKVNFFLALLGYSIIFVILNILLLIVTHLHVKKDKGFVYKTL